MRVIIEFETDNAAFVDSWDWEIGRVLDIAKDQLQGGQKPPDGVLRRGPLRDSNGNRIGHVQLEDKS